MSPITQAAMAVQELTGLVAKVPTSTSVTTATVEILARVLNPDAALVESLPTKSFSAAAVVVVAVATPIFRFYNFPGGNGGPGGGGGGVGDVAATGWYINAGLGGILGGGGGGCQYAQSGHGGNAGGGGA